MGADIHSFAEVRRKGKWHRITENISPLYTDKTSEPFGSRSYSIFGFLADVRNYSHCTPISEPRGLPEDSEYLNEKLNGSACTRKDNIERDYDYHSQSYLTLRELLDFDYEQTFWNRRITKEIRPNVFNGAALAQEGEGETITYREHLGPYFFETLDALKSLGKPEDVRVVFWFDS